MHVLIQFCVILLKSNGLKTCYVYDRVIAAKKICLKDKAEERWLKEATRKEEAEE